MESVFDNTVYMFFLPNLFVGNIKQFYILFESHFTNCGYTLLNLYEFQMVLDILGTHVNFTLGL